LVVESVRRDRIAVELDDASVDPLTEIVGKTLAELNANAVELSKAASTATGHPSIDIYLPALDEFSLGQLFQMCIIARVLETRVAS
jgi:glucose-6-phosphate isomerase